MTFAVASLGSVGDTNARSTYTCALSGPPDPNTLVLVGIVNSNTAGTVVDPSAVSGAGLVFSLITSGHSFGGAAGSENMNLSLWKSMGPSPVNSVISVNFAGGNQTGCAILVDQVSGVSTSGTSGAKATSSVSATDDGGGASSSNTCTAPSAASTANAWYSVGGVNNAASETPGQNWTFLQGVTYATPNVGLSSGWTTLSTGTTAVWSGSGSARRGIMLVELVLDNPAAAATPVGVPLGRPYRIPNPPSDIVDPKVYRWMVDVAQQLNSEAFISKFSAADPNTSGLTGIPGNLAVNVGSASTWTRLWVQSGSVASISTTSWHPFRVA